MRNTLVIDMPLLLGAINVDGGILVALVEILNNAVAETGCDFGNIGEVGKYLLHLLSSLLNVIVAIEKHKARQESVAFAEEIIAREKPMNITNIFVAVDDRWIWLWLKVVGVLHEPSTKIEWRETLGGCIA